MSEIQVWVVALFLVAMTFIWIVDYEDDPNVHVKNPRKRGKKNNKK